MAKKQKKIVWQKIVKLMEKLGYKCRKYKFQTYDPKTGKTVPFSHPVQTFVWAIHFDKKTCLSTTISYIMGWPELVMSTYDPEVDEQGRVCKMNPMTFAIKTEEDLVMAIEAVKQGKIRGLSGRIE